MSYSVREVAAMLGLTPSQVRSYAHQTVLTPDRGPRGELRFGFHDLVLLRTASELAAAEIPGRKVRRALARLREQLPEGQSLTGVRIAADGDHVVVRDGDAVWNPESGQSLFDFAVSEIAEKAATLGPRASRPPFSEADETFVMPDDVDTLFEHACEIEETSIDDAKSTYERILEIDANHADAHVNLGRILHEEGEPAAAERHYAAALAADPEHSTAAFNLGVALEDLGRVRDAIEAYGRALALDPDNADAHYNLAGLYEKRGDKASALRHLKLCRKLS
jgi:tetratricopeptide (TPR) repeat protein